MAEFPIDSNDRRAQYAASGGQTVFPYDFPIFAESEITVYRTRAGATSTLALATDYAVSGVGAEAGGNEPRRPQTEQRLEDQPRPSQQHVGRVDAAVRRRGRA